METSYECSSHNNTSYTACSGSGAAIIYPHSLPVVTCTATHSFQVESPCRSVMQLTVLHLHTKYAVVGFPIPKIWLICGHSIKRPGDLDLSTSKWGHWSSFSFQVVNWACRLLGYYTSYFATSTQTYLGKKSTSAISSVIIIMSYMLKHVFVISQHILQRLTQAREKDTSRQIIPKG